MKRKALHSYLIAAMIVGMVSCDKKTDSSRSDIRVNADTSLVAEAPKQATTAITFKESTFDFGKINEGDKVEHTFEFTNTGEHPLVISNANASCGCTLPEWTKDPVMPGKDGKIRVKYDSSGKEGKINKTVTVLANTEPEATVLNIAVEVMKKDAGQGPKAQ
jgi:hypothetical protein